MKTARDGNLGKIEINHKSDGLNEVSITTFAGLSQGAHRIPNFLQENERKQTDPARGIHFDIH